MALDLGYRAIDTAFIYNNQKTERGVGACLAAKFAKGELKREDIFITTKHWRKYHGYDVSTHAPSTTTDCPRVVLRGCYRGCRRRSSASRCPCVR